MRVKPTGVRTRSRSRYARDAAAALLVTFGLMLFVGSHLEINHTASVPIGVYWRWAIAPSDVRRGELVIACLPIEAALFGRDHAILDIGDCPGGVTSQLKIAAGVAGDVVTIGARGVQVNRVQLSGSAPLAIVRGLPLPRVRPRYQLGGGEFWLASTSPLSYDSRYYGPVTGVRFRARPLCVGRCGEFVIRGLARLAGATWSP